MDNRIYVEIVEEPKSDGTRFRYEKEGRNAGLVKGVKSERGQNTYPAIKIHGYCGAAFVVVSLVSVDGPRHYPHPHKLDGEFCKHGVYGKQINCKKICCFSDLRIQCVKRKGVKESLDERKALLIDPFGTGFSHASEPSNINFNAVRLCFQVLLPDENCKFCIPLTPVISAPIFDNKTISDLAIVKLSACSAPVSGDKEVILLCGNVNKDDIEIIFYEEEDGKVIWTAYGKFSPHDVHRKAAISFKTPAYHNLRIQKDVKCHLYLKRPSDGTEGKRTDFILYPSKEDPDGVGFKRHKFEKFRFGRVQVSNLLSEIPDDVNARIKKVPVRAKTNDLKDAVNQLDSKYVPGSEFNLPASVLGKEYLAVCKYPKPVSRKPAKSTVICPNVPQNIPAVPGMSGLNHVDDIYPAHQDTDDTFAAICAPSGLNNADDFWNSLVNDTIQMLSSLDLDFDHSNPNPGLNDLNATSCLESRERSSIGLFGVKISDGQMPLQNNGKLLQDDSAEAPTNDSLNNVSGVDFGLKSHELISYIIGISLNSE